MAEPIWVSLNVAMQRSGVSDSTIAKWRDQGRVAEYIVGKKSRVNLRDVWRVMRQRRQCKHWMYEDTETKRDANHA